MLPNKHCSGLDTVAEDHQRTPGKEIWRKECGHRVSGTAGGRWRRQHRIELDEDK